MPTGYTEAVQSGEISELPDFALRCARAFGALVDLRDEPLSAPIPERLHPHVKYHEEQIAKASARLADLRAMSPDEVQRAAAWSYAQAHRSWQEYRAGRQQRRQRYETMLAKVSAWEPPTPEHVGLKHFMVVQLTESIEFDCNEEFDDAPVAQQASAWLATEVERAQRDLNYHVEALSQEVERTESRNAWLAALRASLEVRP